MGRRVDRRGQRNQQSAQRQPRERTANEDEQRFLIDYGVYQKWKRERNDAPPKRVSVVKNKLWDFDYLFRDLSFGQLVQRNSQLAERIDYFYKAEKSVYKWLGDTEKFKCPIIFTNNQHRPLNDYVADLFGEKEEGICLSYIQSRGQFNWLDKGRMIDDQMRIWRKLWKQKKIKLEEFNNQEHELNGRKWYSLTIQPIDENGEMEECNMCVGSMELFSYHVSGMPYYFTQKINRDKIYEYITKPRNS